MKKLAIVWRTRRAPDCVAVGQQKRRQPAPNDTGGASHEDSTHEILLTPISAWASLTSSETHEAF
jgi:hypothetical protein